MRKSLDIAYLIKHPVRTDTGMAEFNRALGIESVLGKMGHLVRIVPGFSGSAQKTLFSRALGNVSPMAIVREFRRAVNQYKRGIAGADVIVLSMSGPLSALAGWLALRGATAPVILHVADIPSLFEIEKAEHSLSSAIKWSWFRQIERRLYQMSDHIVIVSPGFREDIESLGIPPGRISMITNAANRRPADRGDVTTRSKRGPGLPESSLTVIYAGNMTDMPGLELLMEVAGELKDENVSWILVGDGPFRGEFEKHAERNGLANVRFTGSLSLQDSASLVASCDLAVIPLLPGLRSTIPSKVYGTIMSHTPVLGIGPVDGALADLIEATGIGVMLPRNPQLVADAIKLLANQPKFLARFREREAQWEDTFDIETVYAHFARLVEAAAEGREILPIDNLQIAQQAIRDQAAEEPPLEHSCDSSSPALSYILSSLSSRSRKSQPELPLQTSPSS